MSSELWLFIESHSILQSIHVHLAEYLVLVLSFDCTRAESEISRALQFGYV